VSLQSSPKNYHFLSKKNIVSFLFDNALYIIIALLIGLIILFEPSFLNLRNFNAILTQSSTRLIFACGVGGIIILGGTDLSLGRAVGLAGVLAASMLQNASYGMKVFDFSPLPLYIPILLAMVVTMLISVAHGFVVSKWNIAPFIASLGFQQVIYGLCSLYFNYTCKANPISNFTPEFIEFTQGRIYITSNFSISYIMLYAIAICFLTWFIWNKTILGKHMYAIGGNREAAKVSGVNVLKQFIIIYLYAGLLYGFGGVLEAGRTGSAISSMGQSYELDAIAACVVGGISMRGGTGNIPGLVLGVIIFQIIAYGLIYISVPPELQYIVKGLIIIFAVAIDTIKYMRKN
jgi:methyl-galactoside transport system permease protein